MPHNNSRNTQLPVVAEVHLAYASTTPDPISFKAGDLVKILQPFIDDPDWSGWVKCENAEGKSGWTPLQVLRVDGDWATALFAYTANELTVSVGERLKVANILKGWAWSQTNSGEWGWVPLRNLAKVSAPPIIYNF